MWCGDDVKVIRCRRAYDVIRLQFQDICGNIVDAGNALWLGLAMYAVSAIFMFFFALQLSNAARTAENRVRPARDAVVDLDLPPPVKKESAESDGDWRRKPWSYRVPGETYGDWLQEDDERQRRRTLVT